MIRLYDLLDDAIEKEHILHVKGWALGMKYFKSCDMFVWCYPDTGEIVPDKTSFPYIKRVILSHKILIPQEWEILPDPTKEV